jgi:GH24 family phage-related lysozyme (muramidase)
MSDAPKVPPLAVEIVKGFEGFRARPYRDSEGNWTVGYGTFLAPPEKPRPKVQVTREQAEATLRDTLGDCAADLFSVISVPLSDEQLSAVLSWMFNVGCSAARSSTLLRLLGAGDYRGAADQFLRWKYETVGGEKRVNDGLLRRRVAERGIFVSGTKS